MRTRAWITVLCLPVVVSAALVTGAPAAAEKDPASVEPVPEEAKQIKNPQEATPQSVANGKQIYSSQCTMCHGAKGDGKGDLATRFGYAMPDFSDPAVQKTTTDGELYWVVTNGHGKMSGEGQRLNEKTRWDLVNYLRTLAQP